MDMIGHNFYASPKKKPMSASQAILTNGDTYDAEFVRLEIHGVETALRWLRRCEECGRDMSAGMDPNCECIGGTTEQPSPPI